LTIAAGALVGSNRGRHGHAAGLRTTMLVCLAASVAMIQMDLLLAVRGKTPDAFSVMDVMRLPLGILSGIGFIGAGAILRKGDAVSGVTTAASLWMMTVVGLCLGGGQIALGLAATGLAWVILNTLKGIDHAMARERKARLMIGLALDADIEPQVTQILHASGYSRTYVGGCYDLGAGRARLTYGVEWKAPAQGGEPHALITALLALPHVLSVEWQDS
jgi:putative Mg2+ transporter-C (MgtC) family protein